MNKKLISMALTGVLAVGMLSVATPSVADARKTKPETSTDISVKRAPGESIVMTMSQIGTIFQNRYPNAALHSVELNSNDLNYGYKVVGYSKYHQYKMKIDVLVRFLIKIKLLNQHKQNVLQNNNLEMMLL